MLNTILDILLDTLLDALKLFPFLFIAFLIIELIEHKFSAKTKSIVEKSGKFGPLFGGILGAIPQCGFSVIATNLYVTRVVTIGTLIAIYLSTSDEMLPILLSNNAPLKEILLIVLLKVVIGIVCGFVIDLFIKKKKSNDFHLCDDEQCNCSESIFKSSLIHTLKTLVFILIITLVLNIMFSFLTKDIMPKIFFKTSFFGPFITSLIGLIPNCGSSVLISELYINNVINFGSTIAGLLSNSGLALLVLFRTNKNKKENLFILLTIYGIGVIVGIIVELLGVVL